MTIHAKNFIAGEWVAGRERRAGHQPVEHRRRRRRVPARRRAPTRSAAIAAAQATPFRPGRAPRRRSGTTS